MGQDLVFFGVGRTAGWVASLSKGRYQLFGTTRDAKKRELLDALQITPTLISSPMLEQERQHLSCLAKNANLLVTFPPDGKTDAALAPLAKDAKRIIYISSTGVYGGKMGVIDESINIDEWSSEAALRLRAEQFWLDQGAIIFRAPALYSRESGLHVMLRNGTYYLPGDGSNYSSRIHHKDLARLIVAAFEQPLAKGSTYVVGDLKPTRQREIVAWLSAKMNLPMPAAVPLSMVSSHLRSNRRILPTKILTQLGIELEFPTYQEGFADCLKEVG